MSVIFEQIVSQNVVRGPFPAGVLRTYVPCLLVNPALSAETVTQPTEPSSNRTRGSATIETTRPTR